VRETVAVETLASLATSLIFMSFPENSKQREIACIPSIRFSQVRRR
jgi:hypothetical protein